jgi:hypothetical protein
MFRIVSTGPEDTWQTLALSLETFITFYGFRHAVHSKNKGQSNVHLLIYNVHL